MRLGVDWDVSVTGQWPSDRDFDSSIRVSRQLEEPPDLFKKISPYQEHRNEVFMFMNSMDIASIVADKGTDLLVAD